MQNNNHNDYPQEDRIDLGELFKFLISSKKIIIVITLFITTLGAIYSFLRTPEYKSTALIEIGMYWQDEQTLIEPAEALTKELNINFIYRQGNDFSINSFENRLIQITSTSPSSVKNKNLLNEVVRYIENRHSNLLSNLTQKTKNQLTYKIESLNDQIEFSNNRLLSQLTNKIIILNNELPNIDSKIESLNEIIIADQDNLLLLKSDPELFIQRAAQSPTLDQVIHSYNNQLIDIKGEKIRLSQEKDNLERQLTILESNNLESDEIFKLSQENDSLESQLTILESNDLESNEIFKLSQEKDALELELAFLMQQNPTSTQLIGEIETNKDGASKAFYILLSFMFGLFLSIVIVFINASLKTSKEYKS